MLSYSILYLSLCVGWKVGVGWEEGLLFTSVGKEVLYQTMRRGEVLILTHVDREGGFCVPHHATPWAGTRI
jgi:hypothetical protein